MKTSLSPIDISCYSDEQLDANFIKARPEKWPREDWTKDSSNKVRIDENGKGTSWHDVQATTISQIVKECNVTQIKTYINLFMLL